MAGNKKKDENNNKPKNKKKLLILLIPIGIILIAAIAAAVIFVPRFMKKEKKKVVVKPPEFYFTKKDAVDAVTIVLGERRFALIKEEILEEDMADTYDFLLGTGTVIPDPDPETETESADKTEETGSAAGTESVSQEDPAQTEEATQTESVQEAESASETETVASVILEVYQYYPGEIVEAETESGGESESAQEEQENGEVQGDSGEEVETYLEYLQTEKSFIDITDIAVNMGEFGEFAQEDSDEEAKEEEEPDGPVFHVLTGPAANEENSLLISVICYPEYYQIRTWTLEVPWTQQMSALWEERDRQDELRRERALAEEQGEMEGASEEEETKPIDTIEELVSSLGQEALQLSEPVEHYEFIFNAGGILIHGKTYARVGAYYKNEKTGTVNYECTFLVDENGEVHYKYHDATGEVESLDEKKDAADDNSESAEEESLPEESETESKED